MKVIDRIQKCDRDLTTAELIDMVAKENRQFALAVGTDFHDFSV